MGREAASHEESRHRRYSQLTAHALEQRVKELERDVVQLLYERDAAIAQRDKARDTACWTEELYNELKASRG